MAHWYGTLAAVRELGRRGVEVYVAASGPLQQARWSRYAVRHLSCPNERQTARYADWLVDLGRRNPGMALCGTSDDHAFVHAARQRELSASFYLDTPGLAELREILDKARLQQQGTRAGMSTPHTVFPADAAEAEILALSVGRPLLIKQRTQVCSRTLHKGTPIGEGADLRAAYDEFRRKNPFERTVLAHWPDADRPILQEYLARSSPGIYSLSGFIAPGGDRWATRAALKVLSHPRQLGIGLLFEGAPVLPELEQQVLRLCRNVGYHGVFECEFLEYDGRHLMIDFNPRFYNYMAFDHARGLPQAYLAYLLAIGSHDLLAEEIERARTPPPGAERMVFTYRLGTWTQLRLERLFRRINSEETARWRAWRKRAEAVVDPVWAPDDVGPGVVDLLAWLWNMARHPRGFVRRNTQKAL
jgi:predicted ATP-grasp superfamily ATP-dependent carboligase